MGLKFFMQKGQNQFGVPNNVAIAIKVIRGERGRRADCHITPNTYNDSPYIVTMRAKHYYRNFTLW